MEIKVKKLHKKAVIPTYAMYGDAGLDLTATTKELDDDGNVVYGTGLSFEIPDGYVGLLFPRSSNSKTSLLLSNSVGVLDSGYRGEVKFKYKILRNSNFPKYYDIGDRIGQLIVIPYPKVRLMEVDKLSESERGDGGYGSTGK